MPARSGLQDEFAANAAAGSENDDAHRHLSQMSATGPIAQSAEGSCLVVRKARAELREAGRCPAHGSRFDRMRRGTFLTSSLRTIADRKRRRSLTRLKHPLRCCN